MQRFFEAVERWLQWCSAGNNSTAPRTAIWLDHGKRRHETR
jgi:hypothetical protein